MATFTLSDYVFNDLGQPVGQIQVRAYALNEDGSYGTVILAESSTSSVTGRWDLPNLDTTLTPTGIFAIQIKNTSTGQTRWRMGDIRLQVGFLTGKNGEAPLDDETVVARVIGPGAVTDVKIGNRTVSDTIATPITSVGPLTQILSFFSKKIKDLQGTANWTSAVPISLEALRLHTLNVANPHATTAQQVVALQNMSDTKRVYAGTEANLSTASGSTIGDLYLSTDTRTIFRKTGTTTWTTLVTGNYENLINKPSPTATAYNSDRLIGVRGGLYAQLTSVAQALSPGASLTTGNFAMQAGSVVVTSTAAGIANVSPPISIFGGFVTILITNGDSDRTGNAFSVKDHYIGSSTYFQIYTGSQSVKTVRVNFVILFW
jgi:hypothetical protein